MEVTCVVGFAEGDILTPSDLQKELTANISRADLLAKHREAH